MFRLASVFAKPALQQSKSLLLPKEVPFRILTQQHVLTKPTQMKYMVPSFSFSSNTHNKSKSFSGPNRGTPRPAQQPANNRLKEILDVFAYKYRKGSLSKEETIRLLANIGKLLETPIPGLKPSETIKYLTEALVLAEKVGITDAIELGHIYNVIFILYFTAGNLEKAEEFVNNATAIYAKAVESGKAEGHARLIETQFAKANIYNKREELDKARDIFLEIESKKDQIPKEDLVHCMPLLYDGLGDICFNKRELAEVTKYREKAIAEVVKNFGEDSKEVVYYLNKLTDALVQEGDLSRALENAQRTLETSLKHNGEYSQESTSARLRVAMIYMRRKEYDEGLKHYEKAMEVVGQLANYSKEQILQDRILLARAYFETGREQQANQIVNTAIRQLIEEVGEGPQVAQFYSSWGETLITKDNTKAEGVSYLQKALDIYNKLASTDESLQIMKHYANGKILFYQGQGEEAIKELNKAIELNFLAEKKPEPMEKMYSFLGRVCLQFNKVNESIENFEKAIQVSEKDEQGFQDIEPYSGYVDLGMAYEQGNQLEKAAEAYQKALDLGVKRHTKESKMVLGLAQFLKNVFEKLGRHKDIEKLNEEYKLVAKE